MTGRKSSQGCHFQSKHRCTLSLRRSESLRRLSARLAPPHPYPTAFPENLPISNPILPPFILFHNTHPTHCIFHSSSATHHPTIATAIVCNYRTHRRPYCAIKTLLPPLTAPLPTNVRFFLQGWKGVLPPSTP
jgi:hypothetical protein